MGRVMPDRIGTDGVEAGWIETELKLLLRDETAYGRVAQALGHPAAVRQTNSFFEDDAGMLRAARIGVRLRAEGEARRLTLKGDVPAASEAGSLARRIELEAAMSQPEFDAALDSGLDLAPWLERFARAAGADPLPPPLARFLATIRTATLGRRLACRARFDNDRAIARLTLSDTEGDLPIELALDRTRFPGGRVDQEIEVELGPATPPGTAGDPRLAPRIEQALRRWLEQIGAGEVTPAPSKLARLHRALAADESAPAPSAPNDPARPERDGAGDEHRRAAASKRGPR
ncbi:MAG: CYTH domain-containing protein [Myxococcota bacterium]